MGLCYTAASAAVKQRAWPRIWVLFPRAPVPLSR